MKNPEQIKFLKSLGKLIYTKRKQKGFSRSFVALELATDEKQIRRIENGEVNPTIITLTKLFKVLEISISEIEKIKISSDFFDS